MTVTLFNVIACYNLWPCGVGWGPCSIPFYFPPVVIATTASRSSVVSSSRETVHGLHGKEPVSDTALWSLEHTPAPPPHNWLLEGPAHAGSLRPLGAPCTFVRLGGPHPPRPAVSNDLVTACQRAPSCPGIDGLGLTSPRPQGHERDSAVTTADDSAGPGLPDLLRLHGPQRGSVSLDYVLSGQTVTVPGRHGFAVHPLPPPCSQREQDPADRCKWEKDEGTAATQALPPTTPVRHLPGPAWPCQF